MNKTICKVGYAMITEDEDSITYENIKYFKSGEAGGREVSAEPNGDVATIYADGIPVIIAEDNAGYSLKVTLLSIIDDIEKDWFANTTTETGVLEISKATMRPRFAFVVINKRYNAKTKYVVDTYFYCCAGNRVTRADKTSEGSFDPNYPEYEINATPRPDNMFVRYTQYLDKIPTTIEVPIDIEKAEG